MLQAANPDLFKPLVPKAHNSERQNLPFPSQTKPVKVSWNYSFNFAQNITKSPQFTLETQHITTAWHLACPIVGSPHCLTFTDVRCLKSQVQTDIKKYKQTQKVNKPIRHRITASLDTVTLSHCHTQPASLCTSQPLEFRLSAFF